MDANEKRIRQRLKDDFVHYAAKCLKIRTKSGSVEPFLLNKAQMHIHDKVEQQKRETGKVRAIVLKGRQQGVSSYIEGRFYWLVTHRTGVRAFILTHEEDATKNLFEMAKRYHDNCPAIMQPTIEASNAKELAFSKLDSGYRLGTAGNKSVGRSSTIQYLHGSEAAFWAHASEHAKGIMQAVPGERGTEIFLESTANGVGNYFHEQWQLAESGQSDFIPIFVPWYWQDEYSREVHEDFHPTEEEVELKALYSLNDKQILWRRFKIIDLSVGGIDGSKAFLQEYPNTAIDAFQISGEDTFIDPMMVMRARKTVAEPYGPLLIGVDPARFGDDRTAIIRRQGRCAYNLQTYIKKSTMEVVGYVHQIIINENPTKVFIDVGGLGAGVVDRLMELGFSDIIVAVNAGNTPLNLKRYFNKRAEMWGLAKEWFLDEPCQIPDNDELHADLCNIKYSFDSNTRLKMEKKEEMKKRAVRSSDCADALCLTFALPDVNKMLNINKNYQNIAKSMHNSTNYINKLKKSAYKS